MGLYISDEQLSSASNGDPLELFDPVTQATFVLVRSGIFRSLNDPDSAFVRAMYPLVNELMAEDDANDPLLESYQKY